MSTLPAALARGKTSQVLRLTIPAGGSELIRATGSRFYVCESPARLRIKADQGSAADYGQGCGLSCTDGAFFEWLEVLNPSASEVSVVIYVGFADYIDQRAEVLETPSRFASVFAGTLAAGASVTLTGITSGRDIRRKALLVSNGSAELRLQIRDESGAIAAIVLPEQVHAFPTSGAMIVHNPHGVGVECYVSEILFTL
jgi:hypothetical protein